MPQQDRHSSRRETAALGTAAALPGAACLAVGGVHPLAHLLLAAGALGALALLVVERHRAGRPLRTSWLGAPLAVGLAATLSSLLPLPHGLRALLDAESADRIARVAVLLASTAGADALQFLRPVLAYEPPEAALAALRLLAALALFTVIAHAAARTHPRRLAYRVLAASAAAVFLAALAHGVLEGGAHTVWGLRPSGGGFFHAPLVNGNHLGKVFAFFALLLAGRALSIRRSIEAASLLGGGLLCALGVWWTDSRGSLAALCAGGALLAVLLLLRRAGDAPVVARANTAVAVVAVFVTVAAIAACTLGADALAGLASLDPEGAPKSKLRLLPYGWLVAREHAVLGTGPGAFGLVLPSHLDIGALDASRFTYTHVENIVLQTATDHGLIVATALFGLVTLLVWRVARSGAALASPGPAAAVAALLTGELLDFSTELPAGLLLLAAGLGLLAGKAQPRLAGPSLAPGLLAWPVAALVVTAALVAFVGARDWRRALTDDLAGVAPIDRRPALQRALARHPSDAQLAYALAVDARQRRDPRTALRFANRALVLWPPHRGAHVEAARALAALGNVDQALIEYRTAWRCGWPEPELLDEVLGRFPSYALRRRAFPDDPASLTPLCQALRKRGDVHDAQTCFDDVGSHALATPAQRAVAIHHALERNDVDGAVERLEADLAPLRHASPDAAAAVALALERRDGPARALARTERWPFAQAPFLAWRARAALAAGRDDIVDGTLSQLDTAARDTAEFIAARRIHADVLERRGKHDEALEVVTMLAARAPGDVELWLWKGRLELHLGLKLQADETARRAERAWPSDPRVHAFLTKLRGN